MRSIFLRLFFLWGIHFMKPNSTIFTCEHSFKYFHSHCDFKDKRQTHYKNYFKMWSYVHENFGQNKGLTCAPAYQLMADTAMPLL